MEFILTTPDQIQTIVKSAILEIQDDQKARENIKLYTINKVAKKLGMAHTTVSNLVKEGAIKTTVNGRITEEAIEEYLKNK